jgi:hypothetical protein
MSGPPIVLGKAVKGATSEVIVTVGGAEARGLEMLVPSGAGAVVIVICPPPGARLVGARGPETAPVSGAAGVVAAPMTVVAAFVIGAGTLDTTRRVRLVAVVSVLAAVVVRAMGAVVLGNRR